MRKAIRCGKRLLPTLSCTGVFAFLFAGLFPVYGAPNTTQTLSEMYHTARTIREGAPNGIEAIAQTRDGFLWLGTDNGLFRFDGRSFIRYHPASGEDLLPGTIPSLLATDDGGLWIGYPFAGASFLKQGHNTNFGKTEGLVSGMINSFVQDKSGAIWAATNTGLLRLQGSAWHKVGAADGFTDDYAFGLLVDRRGTLWVGCGEDIFKLESGGTRFARAAVIRDGPHALAEAPDGALWISQTGSAVVRKFVEANGEPAKIGRTYHIKANVISFGNDGSMWLATDSQGLYRVADPNAPEAPHSLQHFAAAAGLTSNHVTATLVGREGSIWTATTKGLDEFRTAAFTSVALPENWFRVAIVTNGPQSILAAGNGLVKVSPEGVTVTQARLRNVTSAYRDPQGAIWFGEENGLVRYTSDALHSIPLPAGLDPFFHAAQTITMDRSGGLWVSFLHTGFMYYANGQWTKPAFPTASVHEPGLFAYTDSGERVWFGMKHSRVEVLSARDHIVFSPETGLDVGDVTDIYDHAGQIWIGGAEGLDFERLGRFHPLHLEGDLPIEGVSGLVQAVSGDLWINQASGIIRVAASEVTRALHNPESRVQFVLYNYLDGLTDTASQIRPNPTALETADGRLYFATRTQLVWIDPAQLHKNDLQPAVFVESLTVEGKQFSDSGKLRLPANPDAVQIAYTAPSLLVPDRVHFRYKLEGFDRSWQDAGTRRQAFYPRLPPGTYAFRVLACNSDGLWNETGATVRFEIPPSFLQSVGFKALCASALLLLAGLLYRVRIGWITRELKARLYERLTERERIARDLHDTFFQSIQGLLLRFNTATNQLKPDEPARNLFKETLRQSDEVMLQGRQLVLDLRTGIGELGSLSEAFMSVAAEERKNRDLDFKVLVQGEPKELHPLVFEEAYRIGKEAISNAFQHSASSSIEAELNYETNGLRIRIRDNGVGIDPGILNQGCRENHWGLPGMRERARKIGAGLDLWSRKGAGTEVELRIPAAVAYRMRKTESLRSWSGRTIAKEDSTL